MKLSEIVRQESQSERYISTGYCGINLVNIANRIAQLEKKVEEWEVTEIPIPEGGVTEKHPNPEYKHKKVFFELAEKRMAYEDARLELSVKEYDKFNDWYLSQNPYELEAELERGSERFDRVAYQREYMRKRRAKK